MHLQMEQELSISILNGDLKISLKNSILDLYKDYFINNYSITFYLHQAVLDTNHIRCFLCNKELRKEYYLFFIKEKDSNKEKKYYFGIRCAEKLLFIAGKEPIPLFDPLEREKPDKSVQKKNSNRNYVYLKMVPINRELFDAINIVSKAWGDKSLYTMTDTLNYLSSKPDRPTDAWAIIKFNNVILANDNQDRTLLQIVGFLQSIYPSFKSYKFPLMQQVLLDEKVKSYLY